MTEMGCYGCFLFRGYRKSRGCYEMKRAMIALVASFSVIGILGCCLFRAQTGDRNMGNDLIRTNDSDYPVNSLGLSYGPDMKDSPRAPDLVLVENADGVSGYVKYGDLIGGEPSLSEAASGATEGVKRIPMYTSELVPINSWFTCGGE